MREEDCDDESNGHKARKEQPIAGLQGPKAEILVSPKQAPVGTTRVDRHSAHGRSLGPRALEWRPAGGAGLCPSAAHEVRQGISPIPGGS